MVKQRDLFFNWCTFLVGSCSVHITDRQYVVLSGKVMSHGVALFFKNCYGIDKLCSILFNFDNFYNLRFYKKIYFYSPIHSATACSKFSVVIEIKGTQRKCGGF